MMQLPAYGIYPKQNVLDSRFFILSRVNEFEHKQKLCLAVIVTTGTYLAMLQGEMYNIFASPFLIASMLNRYI